MKSLEKKSRRVPVGSESTGECSPSCPACHRSAGAMHAFGCAHEQCPECGKFLVGCACNCLSVDLSEKMIKALHDQFTCLEDAVQIVAAGGLGHGGEASYLLHAAMQYLYENVAEDVRDELNRDFHTNHPQLIPLLQDEKGLGYYTAEQLSLALQIPLAEVHEKIEAMLAAGQGIRFGHQLLRKVH